MTTATPDPRQEKDDRSQRILLLTIRALFVVLMLGASLLPWLSVIGDPTVSLRGFDYLPPFLATTAFAVVVLLVDILTPNKRLASVFGIYLGIVTGLFAALAVGALVDLISDTWGLRAGGGEQYVTLLKLALGITFCYLAVSVILTTKDNFRLVIPYVEFSRKERGTRPLVLDTSVLIDGRIESCGRSGFLDAPLLVPQFVIDELHRMADAGDRLKRQRGRRGLGVLNRMREEPRIDIEIDATEHRDGSVDRQLIDLAEEQHFRILTIDDNLIKVARIKNVVALNLHDLAGALRAQAIPGEKLQIEIVKEGENAGQGVGYLDDGTMVVVEGAGPRIGQAMECIVTNVVQTSAGRMIFGRPTTPTRS